MIVGADASSDATILSRSAALYSGYGLKRVYYSAFSPIPDASTRLPLKPPPLMREHRLYQADWLMRFYGFEADEITTGDGHARSGDRSQAGLGACAAASGFPSTSTAPTAKCCCACRGWAPRAVDKIISTRRHHPLRLDDVARLCQSLEKVRPFIAAADWSPGGLLDERALRGAS